MNAHNVEEMTREDAMKDWLDARGLVAVPKEPTEMTTSVLNSYVCRDAYDELGRRMWRQAIAECKDPFKDETP